MMEKSYLQKPSFFFVNFVDNLETLLSDKDYAA